MTAGPADAPVDTTLRRTAAPKIAREKNDNTVTSSVAGRPERTVPERHSVKIKTRGPFDQGAKNNGRVSCHL